MKETGCDLARLVCCQPLYRYLDRLSPLCLPTPQGTDITFLKKVDKILSNQLVKAQHSTVSCDFMADASRPTHSNTTLNLIIGCCFSVRVTLIVRCGTFLLLLLCLTILGQWIFFSTQILI